MERFDSSAAAAALGPVLSSKVIPMPEPSKDVTNGFARILSELAARFTRPASLDGLADAWLTLGNRQQRSFGFAALPRNEQHLFQRFRARSVIPIHYWHPGDDPCTALFVGIRAIGRCFIERGTSSRQFSQEEYGFIPLTTSDELLISEIEEANAAWRLDAAAPAIEFFRDLTDDELGNVVTVVRHALDHIDPVVLYTHASTFTNFGRFNNLLGRMSEPQAGLLLDDLMANRHPHLSDDEKEFLFCLYVLKGGSFRGEEFSGQQLNCNTVREYLARKLVDLGSLVGEPAARDAKADLRDTARECKRLKEAIRHRYFVTRRINGLCFHKDEMYVPRTSLQLGVSGLPASILELVEQYLGRQPTADETVDQYFAAYVASALPRMHERTALGLNPIEDAIRSIVEAAIEETRSEIGMARGFRDLSMLQQALQRQDVTAICGYPTTDYYCAVFASRGARRELFRTPGLYKRIATAISTRMTFNGWHYTPGHFAPPLNDGQRHFYFPPRMTDRAEWSDQHHTGHVQARVRYSIRSPASLVLCDRKYYGVIDVRLMRDTVPYADGELLRAREYSAYLRALMQAVAQETLANGPTITIEAFTKDWYGARSLDEVS